MNIKERTEYTQTILSIFLSFGTMAFGVALLGSILNIVGVLLDGESFASALLLLLRQLFLSFGVGLAGGWIFAAIIGGWWLVAAYFERKKIKFNALTCILLAVSALPIGLFTATPYAIYSAAKFKIPLKIEFRSSAASKRKKYKK
ncbi:MAG: hypothetical protein FWE68_01015 [Defluviitaleaceae bacterium]|nr:hypothetical protein [Defluviitaleaceae bacterium]